MSSNHLIVKASGEKEHFDISKLENSLKRSGADDFTVSQVLQEITDWIFNGATTREIYKRAFNALKKKKLSTAARYSLKKGLMELGPSGYPFEHFIGQLLKYQGFEVQVGVMVQGQCISHEVDVVATSGNKQNLIECKFYNTQGKFANVQVPLYIRSRVDDIIKKRKALPEYKDTEFYGWIITNTRFTSDAEEFGKCSGLHLMGWDYPTTHSLKAMIEKNSYFPVTVLNSIEKFYLKALLKNGIVVCHQIQQNPNTLLEVGIKESKINRILNEVEALC
ncbi:MAG: restriction endonuclease [Candidatus Kapabacteria bacterium]|nr:restriction endonuclease [Ignavibacteriota bacterium]MCW5883333.1 restriction endonuclease [Candidatus Kapabacteria bacterium]